MEVSTRYNGKKGMMEYVVDRQRRIQSQVVHTLWREVELKTLWR